MEDLKGRRRRRATTRLTSQKPASSPDTFFVVLDAGSHAGSGTGADLDAVQEAGDTALSLSSFFGRPAAVAELVRRGADVRGRDHEGSAPGEVFEAEVGLATRRQIQVG